MDRVRKHHNLLKRHFIHNAVDIGSTVLDVGCGFGGDLHKWQSVDAKLTACDPDPLAIQEARKRLENIQYAVCLSVGDICSCPFVLYDVVCFNFSLHYIFKSESVFQMSIRNIVERIKPGGKLIGCIPDSDMILMNTPFKDSFGNFFKYGVRPALGRLGDELYVFLAGTPFYKSGFKPEPIGYRDRLVMALQTYGVNLVSWTPFDPEGTYEITKMYSKFIFVREL
jgi:SAM-dependent methyltransferase